MTLKEALHNLRTEKKADQTRAFLERVLEEKNLGQGAEMLAPLIAELSTRQAETSHALLEVTRLLSALLAKEQPTTQFPRVQRVELQNPSEEVRVSNFPEFNLPTEYQLAPGTPETRQYVVLVDEEGRPINLSKLVAPAAPSKLGAMFRGGVSLITDTSTEGTLSGTIDGSNQTFTLRYTPKEGTEKVYAQGVRFTKTEDYTITGKTITFNTAPPAGPLAVDYQKQ